MENLEWLCICCQKEKCTTPKISIRHERNCKIIKCLQFVKDDEKILKPPKFKYNIRSEEL